MAILLLSLNSFNFRYAPGEGSALSFENNVENNGLIPTPDEFIGI
jgi:hypothetical protein